MAKRILLYAEIIGAISPTQMGRRMSYSAIHALMVILYWISCHLRKYTEIEAKRYHTSPPISLINKGNYDLKQKKTTPLFSPASSSMYYQGFTFLCISKIFISNLYFLFFPNPFFGILRLIGPGLSYILPDSPVSSVPSLSSIVC
jgi:hypothetical protein